jgi:hypothetical protein
VVERREMDVPDHAGGAGSIMTIYYADLGKTGTGDGSFGNQYGKNQWHTIDPGTNDVDTLKIKGSASYSGKISVCGADTVHRWLEITSQDPAIPFRIYNPSYDIDFIQPSPQYQQGTVKLSNAIVYCSHIYLPASENCFFCCVYDYYFLVAGIVFDHCVLYLLETNLIFNLATDRLRNSLVFVTPYKGYHILSVAGTLDTVLTDDTSYAALTDGNWIDLGTTYNFNNHSIAPSGYNETDLYKFGLSADPKYIPAWVPTTSHPPSIHYAVEIFTDDGSASHTPLAVTDATLGLVNGIFRYVTDRPEYDGSTYIPSYASGEIDLNGNALTGDNTNIFYEGFLQKSAFSSFASNEIDIVTGGDVATLQGIEFIITNSAAFWNSLLTAGPGGTEIQLTGRKVRFSIFIDDVMYSRWQGVITNNPYDEIDYHFACGPNLNVHKMIPPNVINTVTFPNVGIGNQQTSQVSISGAVSSESNIPANATATSDPVPVCLGDIAYAQLFNVDGIPQFEKISLIGRGITIVNPFFNSSCAMGFSLPNTDGSKGDGTSGIFNGSRGGAGFLGGTGHGVVFTVYDFGYALFLISESLSTAYPPGYAAYPAGFTIPGNVSSLYFPTDYFKDHFIFKQGDTKGIRILHSTSSYVSYYVSPAVYRYVYVNILTLAEKPEDFTDDNMLLGPGNGWTVTDAVSAVASPVVTAEIVSDTTTFFQVCKNIIRQIISNFPIIQYNQVLSNGLALQNGLPVLRSFSSNLKLYESVCNLIGKATATQSEITADVIAAVAAGITPVSFPYLQLMASADVQQNGISLLTPILIPATAIKSIDYTYLIDSYGVVLPIRALKDSNGMYATNNIATSSFGKLVDRNRNAATKSGGTLYPDICLTAAGINCTLSITVGGSGEIATVSLNTGGSGYFAEQIVNVHKGAGGGGYVRIKTVDGSGGVTAIYTTPVNVGSGYTNGVGDAYPVDRKGYAVTFSIDLTSLIDIQAEKAFFGLDFIATTPAGGVSGTSINHLSFGIQFRLLDQYNRAIDIGIDSDADLDDEMIAFRDPNGNHVTHTTYQQNNPGTTVPINNLLPKDYYAAGGNDNSETDRFFLASYNGDDNGNAFAEIDLKKILALIKSRVAQPVILVDFLFIGEGLTGSTPYWNTTDTILLAGPVDLNLKIKQIGFVAQKQISTANKSLFAEIKGETVGNDGATETNTPDTAIQHILQDYDKIPTALIDIGNLATTRGLSATNPWYIGRQITDRKNSFDYLQELCQQTFIGYYLSRKGKHTFSSFLENKTIVATHDANIIKRGTINNFVKTDISNLFNDFKLDYNINPGLNKLDHSIIITHIDDAEPGVTVAARGGMYYGHAAGDGFPVGVTYHAGDNYVGCVDTDGIELWKKYCSFPGIPKTPVPYDPTAATPTNPLIGDSYYSIATANGWTLGHFYVWRVSSGTAQWVEGDYNAAYAVAAALWNDCHASWLKTFTIQKTSGVLSQLYWFNDRSVFNDQVVATSGTGADATANLYLQNLVLWITKQKNMVSYSIPINSTTVNLDLLSYVYFKDKVYTNDQEIPGWIVKIESDTANDWFNITLVLDEVIYS